ncbi:hypothetical protein BBB39_10820 [Bordetella trematum]|uniref:Uncharacterized protein n=1 Tax=Bordetella trematum TaxID=123899 RepID=A0A157JQE4_9BORD|nr:hypothetical protein [Bordetella trematum]AUL47354.1 hypothetical protein BTL55_10460 [Bordetella trematum]AZR94217.1 hypothetical protein BBB39_10820 [Bordetella trematum]NNH21386.1 hypothetical protein [Bordetella trematum]QIM72758.1 hypothetical protein EYB34_16115 [Bordetella trematum]SAH74613.1 Uncharacterised protein [Bordetella trematum]
MPSTRYPQGLMHTELLRDQDEIDLALHSAASAFQAARANDGQGHEWAIRVLGADAQARILFWRPEDLLQTGATSSGVQLLGGRLSINLVLDAGHGGKLLFEAGRPLVLHFADNSVAMVSDFPTLLQRDTPLAPPH